MFDSNIVTLINHLNQLTILILLAHQDNQCTLFELIPPLFLLMLGFDLYFNRTELSD